MTILLYSGFFVILRMNLSVTSCRENCQGSEDRRQKTDIRLYGRRITEKQKTDNGKQITNIRGRKAEIDKKYSGIVQMQILSSCRLFYLISVISPLSSVIKSRKSSILHHLFSII